MIRLATLAAASWLMLVPGLDEQIAQCDTPLTESALRELVTAGVPAVRLRQLIANCGIDVGHPDGTAAEDRLKQLGVPAGALTALAPPASPAVGSRWTSPIDGRSMVFIPGGRFRMGSDVTEKNRDEDEAGHEIAVANGFWIDSTEVTNEAYRRFVVSRPEWQKGNVRTDLQNADYLKNWDGTSYPVGQGDAPVVWVGWHAATAYATWAGKRLPSEAEWEYANRANSTSRFWWGEDFDPQRVAADPKLATVNADRRTNPWGLRDSTGSVWEWTSTMYRPYPYLESDGREDPQAVGPRAIRGGSRANGEAFLRSANRNMEDADRSTDLLGFRCAR